MIVQVGGQEFYIDGYLKTNLDYVKSKVLNNNDMMVCIIDGRPGAGKSTIAAQAAYYLSDGKFTKDYQSFTSEQTVEIMNRMQPGDAIVIDESFDQINRRQSMSSANMILLSLLQRMRSKRVFIFILLPYIYDLDKNVILGLSDTFIHCYRQPFGPRGQFTVYDGEAIKKLWLYGRQSYSYDERISKPNFRGKFTKFFPFSYDEYEEKKQKSMEEMVKRKPENQKYKNQRNVLVSKLIGMGATPEEVGGHLGVDKRTVYRIMNKEE